MIYILIACILNFTQSDVLKLNPQVLSPLKLEKAFHNASQKYNIPVKLLITIGFYESSFKPGAVGDGGNSLGIMQVGKQGRRACKCSIHDGIQGEINCGACWLDKGRSWCGDLDGGLKAYINGSCTLKSYTAKQAYKRRLKTWGLLKK